MQIILSTPQDLTLETIEGFTLPLLKTLETGLVSSLLVQRSHISDTEYKKLLQTIIPMAQARNCAVLLHNSAHMVRSLGADGVHINSSHADFIAAIKLLKPEYIVGAGNITSRHGSMLAGEAGADYLCFGSLEGAIETMDVELARWWSKLFQTPCVLFDQKTAPKDIDITASEFIGLGENLWNHKNGPAQELLNIKNSTGTIERVGN